MEPGSSRRTPSGQRRSDSKGLDAGSNTLEGGIMYFRSEGLPAVLSAIKSDPRLVLDTREPGMRRYNISAVIAGRTVGVASLSLSGDRYIAGFGIIPERDFGQDAATMQEAADIMSYLKKSFRAYA